MASCDRLPGPFSITPPQPQQPTGLSSSKMYASWHGTFVSLGHRWTQGSMSQSVGKCSSQLRAEGTAGAWSWALRLLS